MANEILEELRKIRQVLGKVGMLLKGTYNDESTYKKLDVVTYNGQSYVAKQETIGNLPTDTDYWQLIVEKGYTPQKGTDYWTNQDKAEIKEDAVSQVESDIQSTLNSIENTANTANTNSQTAISTANRAESIAKGRATGYVFNTLADLDLWLQDSDNVQKLVIGDNFYIRAVDVPDYWWDGTQKQQLETQKVDLDEYAKKESVPTELADLSEDSTHRLVTDAEKQTWNGKGTYSKPTGGIPKTDLVSAVQTSLEKAETAIQASNFIYDSTTETLSITI